MANENTDTNEIVENNPSTIFGSNLDIFLAVIFGMLFFIALGAFLPESTAVGAVFSATFKNSINQSFFIVLGILFVIALYAVFHKRPPAILRKFPAAAPNLLTGIGILGTFLGIFIGLEDFDIDNISESVPELLKGMTTAFVTSIWGIFLGLLFRVLRTTRKEFSPTADAIGQHLKDGINEQLGESFEQFKIAVENLLQWQENYKTHLETMEAQLQKYINSLASVDTTLASIKENTDAIPKAMEKLSQIIETADETLDAADDTLEAFANMKKQALEAFPTIQNNLTQLNTTLGEQINAFKTTLETHKTSQEELRQSFTNMGNSTKDIAEQFKTDMTQTINDMGGEIKEMIKGNMNQFDRSMQDEVQRILRQMGTVLTSLSNKFVEDYEPLTNRLREILDMAKNVEKKGDGRVN